jgi:hypothetical protein
LREVTSRKDQEQYWHEKAARLSVGVCPSVSEIPRRGEPRLRAHQSVCEVQEPRVSGLTPLDLLHLLHHRVRPRTHPLLPPLADPLHGAPDGAQPISLLKMELPTKPRTPLQRIISRSPSATHPRILRQTPLVPVGLEPPPSSHTSSSSTSSSASSSKPSTLSPHQTSPRHPTNTTTFRGVCNVF